MKITVVGTGYVGLVTGACLAEIGNSVTCVDTDARKVVKLNRGHMPFFEPGLDELVARNHSEGRLQFVTRIENASDADIFFIAVSTPGNSVGAANITQVLAVAADIGRHVRRSCTVINKSTAPVGTSEKVKQAVQRVLARRRLDIEIDVVSNPEFLKEGAAVNDFMRPDRVVIGVENERAVATMRTLYAPITRNHERLLVMGLRDAEMTKYAANAMLATRISFMNEIANLCEAVNVDVENVRIGIGSDSRIGYSFIYPGCGYGGSCFPKDIRALINQARQFRQRPRVLSAVHDTNEHQKNRLYEKIVRHLGRDLRKKKITVWGLSFKPGTDDMREAPSITVIGRLIEAGARVTAYDPVAMPSARRHLPRQWFSSGALTLARNQYAALKGADALALVTEWKPFRAPDFQRIRASMQGKAIFDGRNQFDPHVVRNLGFDYFGIGR